MAFYVVLALGLCGRDHPTLLPRLLWGSVPDWHLPGHLFVSVPVSLPLLANALLGRTGLWGEHELWTGVYEGHLRPTGLRQPLRPRRN